jgi:hypothetical protein
MDYSTLQPLVIVGVLDMIVMLLIKMEKYISLHIRIHPHNKMNIQPKISRNMPCIQRGIELTNLIFYIINKVGYTP